MSGRIIRKEAQVEDGLPRIGLIKCGLKDNRGYPKSVDYFVATGNYAKFFHDVYGDKPSRIQIVFMSDESSHVCDEHYEYRNDRGELVAKGNGEVFDVWSRKSEQYVKVNINERPNLYEEVSKAFPNKKGWEVTLRLRFIMPRIKGVAGSWEFHTKGANSTIPNIVNAFDTMKRNVGFVKGIIFDMTVEFAKSQKPDSKSRYPVVNIVANMSEQNVKEASKGFFKPNTNYLEG